MVDENHPHKNYGNKYINTTKKIWSAEFKLGITTFVVTDLSTDCGICQRSKSKQIDAWRWMNMLSNLRMIVAIALQNTPLPPKLPLKTANFWSLCQRLRVTTDFDPHMWEVGRVSAIGRLNKTEMDSSDQRKERPRAALQKDPTY